MTGLCRSQVPNSTGKRAQPSTGLLSRRALAFNPSNHKLYAVDSRSGSLIVIKGKDQSRISVQVGSNPVAVAVNPVTNRVYVANNGGGSVSVLDGNSDAVLATLNVGKTPYVLAVNEATNKIYLSNTFSNLISVIDGVTNSVHTLSIGSADEIRIDPTHNEIYLLGYESDHILILDGKSEHTSRLPAGALHLWDLALNTTSREAYVTRIGSNDVAFVDKTHETPLKVPTGKMPGAIGIDLHRRLLFAVNYADDTVTIIDGEKRTALATLDVGEHPQAVAVDTDTGLVYIANTHGNSVSVIDEVSRKVIATLPAGESPYALAVDSEDGVVYAADIDDVSVTAIDVSRLRSQTLQQN